MPSSGTADIWAVENGPFWRKALEFFRGWFEENIGCEQGAGARFVIEYMRDAAVPTPCIDDEEH